MTIRKLSGSEIGYHSHSKTIIFLVSYTILYTTFTGGIHAYLIFYPGCLSDYTNNRTLIKIFTVLYPFFPIGACGFNPLLLYALSSAIRRSVNVIISHFRKCSGPSFDEKISVLFFVVCFCKSDREWVQRFFLLMPYNRSDYGERN